MFEFDNRFSVWQACFCLKLLTYFWLLCENVNRFWESGLAASGMFSQTVIQLWFFVYSLAVQFCGLLAWSLETVNRFLAV